MEFGGYLGKIFLLDHDVSSSNIMQILLNPTENRTETVSLIEMVLCPKAPIVIVL